MSFALQMAAVALSTAAMVAFAGSLLRPLLRDPLLTYLGAQSLRVMLALIGAILLGASDLEHRVALIFTLAATYFAAVVVEGLRRAYPDGLRGKTPSKVRAG